jgi:hypothetical protein
MHMNELMRPYWEEALGSAPPELPADLRAYLDDLLEGIHASDAVEHVHVRDFGARDRFLGHGLQVVRTLFSRYREEEHERPLIAYVSLDDGSAMIQRRIVDGVPWFDCVVHFHVKWRSGQWAKPDTIESFLQPCLIVDSSDDSFA